MLFKSPRRWVVGLSLLLTLQIPPLFAQSPSTSEITDSRLVEAVVLNYDKNPQYVEKLVSVASKYEYPDFPKREDILAVVAVESRFNDKSQHLGSLGLMQINKVANKKVINGNLFDSEENIRVGSLILRTYYLMLGSNTKAAIMAYNLGIGGYLKGKRNPNYLKKYLKNLRLISGPDPQAD